MKPIYENDLDKRTVDQAIETIRDRVDALGVSEPLIQEYGLGANQILVELPGISDLDQVKNIIKSTARLEIHAVDGGPFPSEDAALASVNGALPPEQEISADFRRTSRFERHVLLHPGSHPDCGGQRLPFRRPRRRTRTPARDR